MLHLAYKGLVHLVAAKLLCMQSTLEYSTEAPAAKTLAVLRDPSNAKRGAQYLSWHPDGSRKVCSSHKDDVQITHVIQYNT